jgi:hypothetical protein
MNVMNLLTRCGLYQRNLKDLDRNLEPDKTWLNLRLFIQEAYQHCLALGAMTAGQGGCASRNHFARLSAVDDVLDNNTAETIAGMLTSHMANL